MEKKDKTGKKKCNRGREPLTLSGGERGAGLQNKGEGARRRAHVPEGAVLKRHLPAAGARRAEPPSPPGRVPARVRGARGALRRLHPGPRDPHKGCGSLPGPGPRFARARGPARPPRARPLAAVRFVPPASRGEAPRCAHADFLKITSFSTGLRPPPSIFAKQPPGGGRGRGRAVNKGRGRGRPQPLAGPGSDVTHMTP